MARPLWMGHSCIAVMQEDLFGASYFDQYRQLVQIEIF